MPEREKKKKTLPQKDICVEKNREKSYHALYQYNWNDFKYPGYLAKVYAKTRRPKNETDVKKKRK